MAWKNTECCIFSFAGQNQKLYKNSQNGWFQSICRYTKENWKWGKQAAKDLQNLEGIVVSTQQKKRKEKKNRTGGKLLSRNKDGARNESLVQTPSASKGLLKGGRSSRSD